MGNGSFLNSVPCALGRVVDESGGHTGEVALGRSVADSTPRRRSIDLVLGRAVNVTDVPAGEITVGQAVFGDRIQENSGGLALNRATDESGSHIRSFVLDRVSVLAISKLALWGLALFRPVGGCSCRVGPIALGRFVARDESCQGSCTPAFDRAVVWSSGPLGGIALDEVDVLDSSRFSSGEVALCCALAVSFCRGGEISLDRGVVCGDAGSGWCNLAFGHAVEVAVDQVLVNSRVKSGSLSSDREFGGFSVRVGAVVLGRAVASGPSSLRSVVLARDRAVGESCGRSGNISLGRVVLVTWSGFSRAVG